MKSWNRYIKDFVSFLKIERGLAENSVLAYQNDVVKLMDFAISMKVEPTKVNSDHIKAFVKELYNLGLSARTQSRILSGVKQFFHFLMLEGEINEDPSELVEMPKIGRKLMPFLNIIL